MKKDKKVYRLSYQELKGVLASLRECYGVWLRNGQPNLPSLANSISVLLKDETGRYSEILNRIQQQNNSLGLGAKKHDRKFLSETIEKIEREIDRGV